MKAIIIGNDFGIFRSNAASNLVRNISRGVKNCGVETHLISLDLEYGKFRGEINGVSYFIPLKQLKRNKYLIIRLFHRYILSRINLFFYLKNHASRSNSICIIYSEKISIYFLAFLIKPFFNKVLLYCVEHPFREFPISSLRNISPKVYKIIVSAVFDGAICITHCLKEYYATFLMKNLIVIPSVVDPAPFQKMSERKVDYEYICYCGSITMLKDGVDYLIRAFKEVSLEIKDIKLLLLGGFCPPDGSETEFKTLVEELKLSDKVVFAGNVNYMEIPSYYSFAKVLVFPRPESLQAKAGFSTKLPEYLASGKPVIASKVGDIPEYITENEAYLVEPGNINDLKNRIIEVLLDPEGASLRGTCGQKLAVSLFHYNLQGKKLVEFLKGISKNSMLI